MLSIGPALPGTEPHDTFSAGVVGGPARQVAELLMVTKDVLEASPLRMAADLSSRPPRQRVQRPACVVGMPPWVKLGLVPINSTRRFAPHSCDSASPMKCRGHLP